jgi:hypothetical protein
VQTLAAVREKERLRKQAEERAPTWLARNSQHSATRRGRGEVVPLVCWAKQAMQVQVEKPWIQEAMRGCLGQQQQRQATLARLTAVLR